MTAPQTLHSEELTSEPEARWGASATVAENKLYLWRGVLESSRNKESLKYSRYYDLYDPSTQQWSEVHPDGEAPTGGREIALTAIGDKIYSFGGTDGNGYFNEVMEFNMSDNNWRELKMDNPEDGPMLKMNSGMVSKGDGSHICIFAGYGFNMPYRRGREFVPDSQSSEGEPRGWTNELHLLDIKKGRWEIPVMRGKVPPPCDSFSFTRVDKARVVMFGGWFPLTSRKGDSIYILNMENWDWDLIPINQVPAPKGWPAARDYHTAHSLWDPDDPDLQHPAIVVLCGMDNSSKSRSDAWVFDVEFKLWEKVDFPKPFEMKERWFHSSGVLHISDNTREVVTIGGIIGGWSTEMPSMSETQIFQMEFDDGSRDNNSTGWYFSNSVQLATKFLVDSDQNEEAKMLKLEKMYHEALRSGYVDTNFVKCVVMGVPGAGKTNLKHLLFDLDPPKTRTSTSCIEEAQKAFSSKSSEEFVQLLKKIEPEDIEEMVASSIKSGVVMNDKLRQRIARPSHHVPVAHVTEPEGGSELGISDSMEGEAEVKQPLSAKSPTVTTPSSQVEQKQPMPSQLSPEFLKKLREYPHSKELLDVKWLHVTDTGGQPQFLEILPAFLSDVSMQILVFRLSENLDKAPEAEFHREGEKYSLGHFHLKNEDYLLQCAHVFSYQSHEAKLTNMKVMSEPPKLAVVGTFQDMERKNEKEDKERKIEKEGKEGKEEVGKKEKGFESREDKDKRLKELLEPYDKQLLHPRDDSDKVIFGVTAIERSEENDIILSDLRSKMLESNKSSKFQLPIAWYLLEVEIRKLAKEVMSKDECWELACKLNFKSKEELEAALLYLHEVNLILYYPNIVKDMVFVKPSAVHDKVSELLRLHLEHIDKEECDKDLASWKFSDQGLFSKDLVDKVCGFSPPSTSLTEMDDAELAECDKDQKSSSEALLVHDDEVFEDSLSSSLLAILKHLFIISEIVSFLGSQSNYFMPALLPDSSTVIEEAKDPLLLFFPKGCPHGLFCGLVNYLLSDMSSLTWSIPDLYLTGSIPDIKKLYKNKMEFLVLNFLAKVTLVCSKEKSQYEVHVLKEKPLPSMYTLILRDIKNGIKEVCKIFSYTSDLYQLSFRCQLKSCTGRLAVVDSNKCKCECSFSSSLSDTQIAWFQSQGMIYPHRKYHPAYPGVCFLNDPVTRSVDSKGGLFCSEDVSVSLEVPPKAVPEGKEMQLTLWPCLYGPFSLPEGHQLAGPVYLAHASMEGEKSTSFATEVKILMKQFVYVEGTKVGDQVKFVSRGFQYDNEYCNPIYKFQNFLAGRIEDLDRRTISLKLKHFCFILPVTVPKAEHVYSAQVFRFPDYTKICKCIVVSITLLCEEFLKDLEACICKDYEEFGHKCVREVPQNCLPFFCKKSVKVEHSPALGWILTPNRECTIRKDEIDFPLKYNFVCKFEILGYPPRIKFNVEIKNDKRVKKPERDLRIEVKGTKSSAIFSTKLYDRHFPTTSKKGIKENGSPKRASRKRFYSERAHSKVAKAKKKRRMTEPPRKHSRLRLSDDETTDETVGETDNETDEELDASSSSGSENALEEEVLDKLFDKTKKAAHEWKPIGRKLGFKLSELNKEISRKEGCHGDEEYYSEMLSRWLNWAPPKHKWPTKNRLVKALRTVGKEGLAYHLERMEIRKS